MQQSVQQIIATIFAERYQARDSETVRRNSIITTYSDSVLLAAMVVKQIRQYLTTVTTITNFLQ